MSHGTSCMAPAQLHQWMGGCCACSCEGENRLYPYGVGCFALFARLLCPSLAASLWCLQVRAIAQEKLPDLNCSSIESAMRIIAGTAANMGIDVVPPILEKKKKVVL